MQTFLHPSVRTANLSVASLNRLKIHLSIKCHFRLCTVHNVTVMYPVTSGLDVAPVYYVINCASPNRRNLPYTMVLAVCLSGPDLVLCIALARHSN